MDDADRSSSGISEEKTKFYLARLRREFDNIVLQSELSYQDCLEIFESRDF